MFASHALEQLEECTLGEALRVSLCRCNLSNIPLSHLLIYKTFSRRKAFALKGIKQTKFLSVERKKKQP